MKQLMKIKQGERFLYGGVEWVKLDQIGNGALAIAAEPVFKRVFDSRVENDWRVSSLRRELNGPFLDALIQKGADRLAFLDWTSDLTADDGMDDYGSATDKIALLSDGLYRSCRQHIPTVTHGFSYNLTPLTCQFMEHYSCVRGTGEYGTLSSVGAYAVAGVRPLCFLLSEISVEVPEEETEPQQKSREDTIQEAAENVMETLGEYGAAYWVEIMTRVMYGVLTAQKEAEEIVREQSAARVEPMELAPGLTAALTGNSGAAAEG